MKTTVANACQDKGYLCEVPQIISTCGSVISELSVVGPTNQTVVSDLTDEIVAGRLTAVVNGSTVIATGSFPLALNLVAHFFGNLADIAPTSASRVEIIDAFRTDAALPTTALNFAVTAINATVFTITFTVTSQNVSEYYSNAMTQAIVDSRAVNGSLDFAFNDVEIPAAHVGAAAPSPPASADSSTDDTSSSYYIAIGVVSVCVVGLVIVLVVRLKRAERKPEPVEHEENTDEWFVATTGGVKVSSDVNTSHFYPMKPESYLDIAQSSATTEPKDSTNSAPPVVDMDVAMREATQTHFYPDNGGWNSGDAAPRT
jgi:hypothetical protein